MKVMTIVGARPQFIKAAAVSRAFGKYRPDIEEILLHTGQHYDANMSDVFFSEMDIPRPDYNLGIGGGTHGQNTGRMLEQIEELIQKIKPEWMVLYGDTDSTLAGALAASKLHLPIAHVEAGLRSFNRRMPEEINRVVTDHLAELLFAPTETAKANLVREGIGVKNIHVAGDVMYDAALYYKALARPPMWFRDLAFEPGGFALCTIHRAENTNDHSNLRGILRGLATSPIPIVLPLHPRTRKTMFDAGLDWPDNVRITNPVGYLEMVWLETNCRFVLTDSGGVQKEAFMHGKPCITLRSETEWVELVDSGWNRLAGCDPGKIEEYISSSSVPEYRPRFYGSGDAARRMVELLQ